LRNGVEIGCSTDTLKNPGTLLGTHAFVMAQGKTGKSPSWIGVGISRHMGDADHPLDPDATKRYIKTTRILAISFGSLPFSREKESR